MYIKRVVDYNLGPIKKLDISPAFDKKGNPRPLVFVGENGSGKSTVVSNIVDSFYELAGKKYSKVLHGNDNGGHSYYKIISGMQIKIGEQYLFSRIEFDNSCEYIFKAEQCTLEKFKLESGCEAAVSNWSDKKNLKQIISIDDEEIEKIFSSQVICYFGPERYEKPSWLGTSYYDDLQAHLLVEPRFYGVLNNSIEPYDMGKDNFRWLLDIIVDSRTDIMSTEHGLQSVHIGVDSLLAMQRARNNIEKVMSNIIGEEVYFGLNLRREGGARFNIRRVSDNSVISPSMDSLSTGQLALFNIFSTIIRYADNNDIRKSIELDQITGIVVIDEIELHLHSIHQKEVLPKLMRLFPKVQFIITTHSPLLLLGLDDVYGGDNFDIYQMPEGMKIGSERFSEFSRAYSYFSKTETHYNHIREILNDSIKEKPLIITEGATDWKHILAAYNNLSKKEEYSELFDGFEFDILKYEPANSKKKSGYKIEMGNEALAEMCVSFSKMPQKRKMIFIADCDDEKINKKLSVEGKSYKAWGNNVYSLILPVPETRKDTPKICIEHYYSDDEIKTEYIENGIARRLYMGKEFDERGISTKLSKMCEKKKICGKDSISIIEGTSGEKVTGIFENNNENYALAKMKFAENVLQRKKGFDKFNFHNFIKLFEVISEIIKQQ